MYIHSTSLLGTFRMNKNIFWTFSVFGVSRGKVFCAMDNAGYQIFRRRIIACLFMNGALRRWHGSFIFEKYC